MKITVDTNSIDFSVLTPAERQKYQLFRDLTDEAGSQIVANLVRQRPQVRTPDATIPKERQPE